ncbi:aminoacyl-tRNA hydrolase [Candidatus Uhrbacteria bacterium CG_4_10_14_0_2_um_filter_41_7]|uniref:Peptidyl-tRNA hydrolase n=1 Tax=Candidatus Uhrbacteria bacterium CG_4_9_14_3_um_filter_41_35 TaxID=1975034 RepID=A0A2M7XG19_9BACT|nr:MAG: aminoacyl-tRNA hydrolase [Candidatus Uhrbacteria bacterium CG11_big_fil_rev_8_21_14_0_20_41_9]PIZ54320.1 MAG: aminoacyl-tRNA hydrolase [Candidatus Uhrbacteria bacterium CG_4_10_14_0_2_um_filter_41_7]PJA46802.1 MAG: aminoacyl-tRNA hydrolase [Candidatus Uhrbacteria bacterium CG_4_9_14_3_um_filter_41_35]
MILIIGLGNPGTEYSATRHNAGFIALDYFANKVDEKWSELRAIKAQAIEMNVDGKKVVLAKPITFMNLSGEAVQALVARYKVEPKNVWVLHDDVDLELGIVRVRLEGSAGGHNGIKSIISVLGTQFGRIKIGVGATPDRRKLEDWVLSKFTSDELKTLNEVAEKISDLIFEGITKGELTVSTEKK